MVDWHPLKRWLFTTNHKDVGVLYLVTSLYFFVAAGILALTFRTQLAVPSNTFLQPDEFNPAVGGSMMGLALMLLMASSIVSTVNFLVTIFRLRAPGMSLMKLPLFTWGWIFTSLLMLWAFPAFVSALSLLVADRAFGTVFFTSTQGGPLLWDHMFWFFGHPEVYVLLLPGFAIVGDLFSTFSRRPLYAKKIIIACLAIASILSFTVWAHHMFMTGISQSLLEAFNVTTELISIPFAIIVIAYIFTLRGGSIRFTTPMLFAVGALGLFIIGGVTGVFNSSVALDTAFRGTFWVVGHFHYTIVC